MNVIKADETAFRAHHRTRQGPLLLLTFVGMVITAANVVVFVVELRMGISLGDPIPAQGLAAVVWILVTVEAINVRRHVPFYAGESDFTPNVLPVGMFLRGARRIRYDEVVEGRYSAGTGGRWWTEFLLRNQRRVRLYRAPDIPDSALEFLVAKLGDLGVSMKPVEPSHMAPIGSPANQMENHRERRED